MSTCHTRSRNPSVNRGHITATVAALLNLTLGPFVAMFDVPADTNQRIAGIQNEHEQESGEVSHELHLAARFG